MKPRGFRSGNEMPTAVSGATILQVTASTGWKSQYYFLLKLTKHTVSQRLLAAVNNTEEVTENKQQQEEAVERKEREKRIGYSKIRSTSVRKRAYIEESRSPVLGRFNPACQASWAKENKPNPLKYEVQSISSLGNIEVKKKRKNV
ncbi:hypothetical protein M9H77_07561 [Catharanthus roseus]|uniref:Uncharacterized protein n=1 Tax=Catharanthus roseus TaxID=4058 RepID=A0ACC0BVE2_CATRO|nr:hypothetical protein M9H77_07561 [Catharanthus roseus]